jgi:putative selenate reductase
LDLGVKIHYNYTVNAAEFRNIREKSDYLFVAAGAQEAKWVNIPGMEMDGVIDPLQFLYQVKDGSLKDKYKNILIIGGGNTAMDAARTAYRMLEKGGSVRLLYRRTLKEMPADKEEIRDVIIEGIDVLELMSPIEFIGSNNKVMAVKAQRMTLGKKDESGRRRPIPLEGEYVEFESDLVIPAFGQSKVLDFLDENILETSENILATKEKDVFIGGDALNGGLSIIQAVADGKNVAKLILEENNLSFSPSIPLEREKKSREWHYTQRSKKVLRIPVQELNLQDRQSFDLLSKTYTKEEAMEEAARCLLCDEVCNICTTVCPNLALYSYDSEVKDYPVFSLSREKRKFVSNPKKTFSIRQKTQILHLADWCNECGNCNTFCPTAEAPYKSKPHLYLDKEAYDMDSDCYYLDTETSIRYKDKEAEYVLEKTEDWIKIYFDDTEYRMDKDFYTIEKIKGNKYPKDSQKWIEMLIVLEGAKIFC